MNAVEILRAAEGRTLSNEDGLEDPVTLLPALPAEEFRELEAKLPCPLPPDARELLSFSRGFDGSWLEQVDFSGRYFAPHGGVWIEEILRAPIPIAGDGLGNYWVLDITAESKHWGPILFVCHDPPVVAYQCDDATTFIRDVLRGGEPPFKGPIEEMHQDLTMRIWRENPGILTLDQTLNSADAEVRAFAGTLAPGWFLADLREAKLGDGFSWGRFGPRTPLARWGNARLFAYQSRTNWERFKTFMTGR
jgi:hypothetical protein